MASYEEIYALRTNDRLRQQVAVAVVIAAQAKLALPSPSAAQAQWAKSVIGNPGSAADAIVNLILAANSSATVAQITSATDAAVQTKVDEIVSGLIAAEGV